MNDTASMNSAGTPILDAKETKFTSKEMLLYKMIDNYLKSTSNENKEKIYNMIECMSHISLRLLDWFTTYYSHSKCICYDLEGLTEPGDQFNVYIGYKAQLKSYSKTYFDPFRRGKKFYYNYNKNDPTKKVCTTLAQLNFFRWAFTYGIINYVETHFAEISANMTEFYKTENEKKKKEKEKLVVNKKKVIKKPAAKKANPPTNTVKQPLSITLSFD